MADNRSYVYRRLRRELGLRPFQAAGAVGGLGGESGRGLDPNAVNSTSGALGIGQWLGGRARGVQKGNLRQQTDHLIAELKGPERAALNRLRSSRNINEATRAWVEGFERPSAGEIASSMPARLGYSRDAFRAFGSGGGGSGGGSGGSARGGGPARPGASTRTTIETTPGVDNRVARGALVQSFLEDKGADVLDFAMQARQLQDIPATTTERTVQMPGTPGGTGRAASAGGGQVGGGGSGARAALSWAQSKINDPGARETGGANRGQLPDFLNQRFGFGASGGQPWCAMFTSAAVTKGGAPSSARTASVAQVRQKAQAGQGYVRGFIPGQRARPGDLILFGNSHIGMVKSVSGGKIRYVGGNQSNMVSEGTASAGGASIVRPKYGARRRG